MLNSPLNVIEGSSSVFNALSLQSFSRKHFGATQCYAVDTDENIVVSSIGGSPCGLLSRESVGRDVMAALDIDTASYPGKLFNSLCVGRVEISNLVFYPRDTKSGCTLNISGKPFKKDDGKFGGYRLIVQDLSEPVRSMKDLSHYESILSTFVRHVPNLVVVKDIEGRYLTINPLAERSYGQPLASMVGRTAAAILDADAAVECCRGDDDVLETEAVCEVEQSFSWPDGVHTFRTVKFPIHDGRNCLIGIGAVGVDVTHQRQIEDRMYRHANFDALTGLPNHRLLHDRLEQAVMHAQRAKTGVGVVMVDVRSFAAANEVLGCKTGNELLIEAANAVRNACRRTDTVGRMDNETFGVVLAEIASHEILRAVVDKIVAALQSLVGYLPSIQPSIGVTMFPSDGTAAEDLLQNAKLALKQAKSEGPGTICSFQTSIAAPLARRAHVEEELRLAVDRDELKLFYQPIVDAQTKALVGVEALLRWTNAALGFVGPDEFIPIAEQSDLIDTIGNWVIARACRDAKTINQIAAAPVIVSINVSARQLANDDVVAVLAEALRENTIDPRLIKIEMTETAFAEDAAVHGRVIEQLRSLGVSISLDDFGTGYSSLSYLHQFSFNQLKIDKCFIDRLPGMKDGVLLVKGIIRMAHSLRLEVVAEGVETEEQFRLLGKIGCDKIQGYWISRPVGLEALAALIEKG